MNDDAFVSIADAVKRFGVSESTIRRRIKKGDISETQIKDEPTGQRVAVVELQRVFGHDSVKMTEKTEDDSALVDELRTSIRREKSLAEKWEGLYYEERDRHHASNQRITALLEAPKRRRKRFWIF